MVTESYMLRNICFHFVYLYQHFVKPKFEVLFAMEDEVSISLDGKKVGNLRVVDLKQELDKRGLSKSGSKKDLVKRLKQQLEFEKLCEERKSTGDCDLKLQLDAVTEQNEFVQQYLAQQQKIYAEQKEVKRLVELEEIHKSSDEQESCDFPKVEDNQEISEDPIENSEVDKETENINKEDDNNINDENMECQTLEPEDSKSANMTQSSELTSDIEISCNQESSSNMDSTTPIQSVPYSLSDIQLPESPGNNISKSVSQLSPGVSSASHIASEKNDIEVTEKNSETLLHSNGITSPGVSLSSSNKNTSKRQNCDSNSEDATGESCDTPNSINSVNCDEKQNVEKSEKNNLINASQVQEHNTKEDNTVCEEQKIVPNAIVEPTTEPCKESSEKKESQRRRSRSYSEESDNEQSSDSGEEHVHKAKSVNESPNEKGKERERRSRSDSSNDSRSSRNSESSADRGSRKSKPVYEKHRDGSVYSNKSNSVSNAEKTKKHFASDADRLLKYVNATPSKQKLKIKRDNILISETASVSKKTSKDNQSSNVPVPSSSIKNDTSKVAEVAPKAAYTSRKVSLSSRKINRKSVDEIPSDAPKVKKSKWSNFAVTQKKSQTINISMDSLKNWFPDFKLISEPVPVNELVSGENSPSIKEEKVSNLFHTDLTNIDEPSIKPSASSKKQAEPEMKSQSVDDNFEVGTTSKIIFIQNLVRPFTLHQLKELLKQSGNIIEENFWIDKIKSKCFVMYETEEEAVKARNALNGSRWPVSNPKILSVEFATEDDLEYHRRGSEPPKSVPEVTNQNVETYEVRNVLPVEEHRKKERDRKKERERSKAKMPVREWDKDKISQDSPEKENTTNRDSESKAKSAEKRERKDSKRKPNEDTPAKLLDDLFQKTKASPCIYWLPLTDEQVKEREEAKRLRRIEREKRNQQAREQEESERKSKRARSGHRNREEARSSTRSRSPVSRHR